MKLQGLSADIQHRTPTSSWNMTINDFNPKRPHLPLRSFSNSKSTVQCSSSYPTTATMRYHLAIHRTLALIILVSHVCGAFLAPGQPGARVCKSEDRSTSRTGCASHVTRMAATEFGGIQHAGVLVSNTKASKEFYINVLGFGDDSSLRPDDKLPFDGAFVRAGSTQIHLMELPNPDPVTGRPEHGGRDRHIAFTVRDLSPLKGRLDEAGVAYTMSKSGRAALFCRDLDGNAFEIWKPSTAKGGGESTIQQPSSLRGIHGVNQTTFEPSNATFIRGVDLWQ